jgi:hypothetical protein
MREASSYRGLLYRVFSLLPFLAYSFFFWRTVLFCTRQPFLYRARPIFSPTRAIFSPAHATFPARHFPRAPSSPTRPPELLGARNRCSAPPRRSKRLAVRLPLVQAEGRGLAPRRVVVVDFQSISQTTCISETDPKQVTTQQNLIFDTTCISQTTKTLKSDPKEQPLYTGLC